MSDEVVFGDIGPEDVWDDDSTIAPEQLARRLHKLRREVDALSGGPLRPRWEDLDDDERERAEEVAEAAVDWIEEHEPDEYDALARRIHDVRRDVLASDLDPWEDLAPDERAIAVELVRLIVLWLEREGPR